MILMFQKCFLVFKYLPILPDFLLLLFQIMASFLADFQAFISINLPIIKAFPSFPISLKFLYFYYLLFSFLHFYIHLFILKLHPVRFLNHFKFTMFPNSYLYQENFQTDFHLQIS